MCSQHQSDYQTVLNEDKNFYDIIVLDNDISKNAGTID